MFDVQNLWFQYGAAPVLKNMSFSLERGKLYSVVGPNGAGKTTLLNVLTGALKPHQGTIRFLGQTITSYSVEELARYFAIISQRAAIRFPFTCLEIVMMGRNPFAKRLKRLSSKDMDVVHEVMERTDTLRFADTLITEVSGGEFQRVIFARALAQQPTVLFLDEAFSGLDIAHKIRSLKLIRQLVEHERLTVFAIMHDLNFAYAFSDEVLTLKDGELQGFDAPKTLMTSAFIHSVFDIHVDHIEDKGLLVIP
jgi:iron complex transport system ATP-binding protein